jgi:hypothetical protein
VPPLRFRAINGHQRVEKKSRPRPFYPSLFVDYPGRGLRRLQLLAGPDRQSPIVQAFFTLIRRIGHEIV